MGMDGYDRLYAQNVCPVGGIASSHLQERNGTCDPYDYYS
jgi:hypothetical protein